MEPTRGFEALLPFSSEDRQFAYGFEVGRIWQMVRASTDPIDEIAHAANAEMFMRIGEATNRAVASEELGSGWIRIKFEAQD